MDGQVRTQIESEQVRDTHQLESTDRQTDKSGHRRNPSKHRALTNWRAQMDGQVRTWKESEQVRGTHHLESIDRWTSQDTEGIRVSKGHLPTGEHRPTDKSGHRRNLSEQGALTSWRAHSQS